MAHYQRVAVKSVKAAHYLEQRIRYGEPGLFPHDIEVTAKLYTVLLGKIIIIS